MSMSSTLTANDDGVSLPHSISLHHHHWMIHVRMSFAGVLLLDGIHNSEPIDYNNLMIKRNVKRTFIVFIHSIRSSSDVVQPEVCELLLLFVEIISLNTEGIDSERSVSSSSSLSDKHGFLTGNKDPVMTRTKYRPFKPKPT
ncbi:hypothetical protein Tco_1095073 [Tanacetum coccineum]